MISTRFVPRSRPLGITRRLTVFAGLALLAVLLQSAGGAYEVERGAYSDEAAHFLNGLLLREYLTEGIGTHPVRFAEDYYVSYPKIAPLAWPPFFHVLLGLFLLPPWPPQSAALFLVALITAYAAWRLATIVSSYAPFVVALAISVLFLLAPLVLDLSATVMVDRSGGGTDARRRRGARALLVVWTASGCRLVRVRRGLLLLNQRQRRRCRPHAGPADRHHSPLVDPDTAWAVRRRRDRRRSRGATACVQLSAGVVG